MFIRGMMAGIVIVISTLSLAAGEAPKPQILNTEEKQKIEALIRDLGSDEFVTRESAESALISMGKKIMPVIKSVLDSTQEAEISVRCRGILAELEGNPKLQIKTSAGDIELELFENETPNTVANFIGLAESHFYDNLLFHRIIKNFMIQGGDPQGSGRGGPGYRLPDEIPPNGHKCDQYVIAMANSGPDTNGSQFFIVTAKGGAPHLNGRHTVFGKVTKGLDVVDHLGNSPTAPGDRPDPEVKIISVTVLSKREHPYEIRNKKPFVEPEVIQIPNPNFKKKNP